MASFTETALLVSWFVVSAAFVTWIVNEWIHTRRRGKR
jgi:hypothetical protein